jgi:hypothetical protein
MTKEGLVNNGGIKAHRLESVASCEDPRIGEDTIQQILACRNTSGFIPTDDDVRRHLKGDILSIYLEESTGRIVGFDSIEFKSPKDGFDGIPGVDFSFPEAMGVYFAGALIAGEAQKAGLYTRMTQERVRRGIERGHHIVFTETQNPNIEAGIRNTLDTMKQAGEIKDYSMDERVLLPGLYGRCMYEDVPQNDRISYNGLNHNAGDAYALVFNLDY